jgi:hypothetical protein
MKYVFLLVLLLLLTSCQVGPKAGGAQDTDFASGSGSLTMSFVKGSLPTPMRADQGYTLPVKFQNQGAADITGGKFVLIADDAVINFEKSESTLNLHGRSRDYPSGESIIQTFPFQTASLAQESQRVETEVLATACFAYRTVNTADVCVDTDPYNQKEIKKVCQAKDVSVKTGGGPVNVQDIQVIMGQDDTIISPKYIITIRKPANMLVVRAGDERLLCSSRAGVPDKHAEFHVYYSSGTVNEELPCNTQSGMITFDSQNTAVVTCTPEPFDGQAVSTYSTPIMMTLDYGIISTEALKLSVVR